MKARPAIIKKFSEQTKCFMCKHRFDEPLIMPVDKPERGELQPNYNSEYLFHLQDTHGLPHDIVMKWIFGAVYGRELTEMGYRVPTGEK